MATLASVKEAQALANLWRGDDNQGRMDSSLRYLAPAELRQSCGHGATTVAPEETRLGREP